jgi:hypothetical protein
MMVYDSDELLRLARIYSEGFGITLSQLGSKIGNQHMFLRLAAGEGISLKSAEMASAWFTANWPPAWPDDIPRPVEQTKPIHTLVPFFPNDARRADRSS